MKWNSSIFTCVVFLLLTPCSVAQGSAALSWQDCVREAQKHNPELAAALQATDQQKAQKRIALSPMLPQVSAEASTSKTDTFSGGNERTNNTYSVKGEQLLFDGFRSYNDFKSAKENVKASESSATATSAAIQANLRRAFAELLKAQKLIPITQAIIERRTENLKMIRLRYESGREHQGALLLAEADLAQAEFDHRKAKRDISVAQAALRKELGWKQDEPLAITGTLALLSPLGTKPDFAQITEAHPDIQQAEALESAAHYNYRSATSEFFPTFRFTGEAGKVRSGGFSSDDGWSVGLGASLPLFEGGQRFANTSRAKAKLLETSLLRVSESDRVRKELEAAWRALEDAVESASVQEKYLTANEVRAKIARAQYANGLLIFDNWIIIEDNYVRSQKVLVEAQAAMMTAEANWMQARGKALGYEE